MRHRDKITVHNAALYKAEKRFNTLHRSGRLAFRLRDVLWILRDLKMQVPLRVYYNVEAIEENYDRSDT